MAKGGEVKQCIVTAANWVRFKNIVNFNLKNSRTSGLYRVLRTLKFLEGQENFNWSCWEFSVKTLEYLLDKVSTVCFGTHVFRKWRNLEEAEKQVQMTNVNRKSSALYCLLPFHLGNKTVSVVHPQSVGDQHHASKWNAIVNIVVKLAGKRAAVYFRLDVLFQ